MIIVIVLFIVFNAIKKRLRSIKLVAPTSAPVQQPPHYQYKLLHLSYDITASGKTFGLFQTGNDFWLVDSSDIQNPKDLREIYPSFTGRPKGMVVIPGKQFNNSSFIIFSSDGKVYNPFSISHNWRNDFLYLPNEDPISIDGRPLDTGIVNGLFSGNGAGATSVAEGAILFRFYYQGYYIEENGCVLSGTDSTDHPQCNGSSCAPIKSCTSSKIQISPHPPANINSFFKYAGKLYGISSDGSIYVSESGSSWSRDSHWTTTFSGLSLSKGSTLKGSTLKGSTLKGSTLKGSTNTDKLYLMGADYDDRVPIFLIYENGVRYIVDRHARKYDFFHFLQDQSVLTVGNPIDITKAGPGEYDYVVLYSDLNIYGPTLPGPSHSRPISDFESYYPGTNGKPVSITSVNKWQNNTNDPTKYTFNYYLVFLYDDGKWFEIQYDISKNVIGALGQSDQTSGLWTSWSHIVSAMSKYKSDTQTFKMSSHGWSIFIFDKTYNFSNDMVYSINNPPESWIDMLFCNSEDDGKGGDRFKSSTCVGVGEWKDYIFSTGGTGSNGSNGEKYKGFYVYEDYGVDIDSNPGTVSRKVSLDTCLSASAKANVVVYDQAESDCHAYDSLTISQTTRDPTKSIFVNPSFDAVFENRFCVKHIPTNKYMYWDFVDPDNQFMGLNESCTYNGPDVSVQDNPSPTDVQNLQRALGAMWSFTSTGGVSGLRNLNGAVGGFLSPSASLVIDPGKGYTYRNNNLISGDGKCFTYNGNKFDESSVCGGEWAIETVPCTSSSTGYILNFCTEH